MVPMQRTLLNNSLQNEFSIKNKAAKPGACKELAATVFGPLQLAVDLAHRKCQPARYPSTHSKVTVIAGV